MGPIAWGTAGWENDGGTVLELGSGDGEQQPNLVRVTLFRGRSPHTSLDQTQAQGHEVLCQLADGVQIPAKGQRVLVAVPEGCERVAGGCVIIAAVSNNVRAQGNTSAGEVTIQVPGSQGQLTVRKNGAIVFKTTDDNTPDGNAVFFSLGPDGLQIVSPWFTITGDKFGLRLRVADGPSILMYGVGLPSPLDALESTMKLKGAVVKVDGSQVLLGPDVEGQSWVPVLQGSPLDTPPDSAFLNGLLVFLSGLNPTTLAGQAAAFLTVLGAAGAVPTSTAVKVGN